MAYGDFKGNSIGGSGLGGGYGTPIQQFAEKEPARQPEIARYTEELEKLLHGCICSIENMESRISPVSRTDPPSPVGSNQDCATASVPQSTYGQRLSSTCEVARNVMSRIDGMARRLEV